MAIDFEIDEFGDLIIDKYTHETSTVQHNDLRLQLAFCRIKSVSNGWYYDHIGANLESLIGRPCTTDIVNSGKQLILDSLIYDGLWDIKDVHIQAQILNNTNVTYVVYLRVYEEESMIATSKTINVELDLVKGVKIRYGWNPRK